MADNEPEKIVDNMGRVPYRYSLRSVYRRVSEAVQSIAWGDILGKPSKFPPEKHTHTTADIQGLAEVISGDKPVEVATTWDSIQGKPDELVSDATMERIDALEVDKLDVGAPVEFAQLADVPSEFPPAAHRHTMDDVEGLKVQLDRKQEKTEGVAWNRLTGAPSTFPPSQHGHSIAEVGGLQTALDGKRPTGKVPISDVDGLGAKLDAAGKWANLEGKPDTYPPASHGHAISEVNGLQQALDAKRATGAIGISEVTGLADKLAQIPGAPSWAALTDKPTTFPPSKHSHAIAEVTGLTEAIAAQVKTEVVAGKVVTAGVAVAVKFAKTYSAPPVVNSRTIWSGQQMIVGQASNITTTGCSITVMQSRGSLLLSAGPFEPAAAGQSFEMLVIGS